MAWSSWWKVAAEAPGAAPTFQLGRKRVQGKGESQRHSAFVWVWDEGWGGREILRDNLHVNGHCVTRPINLGLKGGWKWIYFLGSIVEQGREEGGWNGVGAILRVHLPQHMGERAVGEIPRDGFFFFNFKLFDLLFPTCLSGSAHPVSQLLNTRLLPALLSPCLAPLFLDPILLWGSVLILPEASLGQLSWAKYSYS